MTIADNRHQAATASSANKHAIELIQHDRARSIYDGCVETNKRNSATRERTEREIIKRAHDDPHEAVKLRKQAKFIFDLIDTRLPRENCVEKREKYVSETQDVQ